MPRPRILEGAPPRFRILPVTAAALLAALAAPAATAQPEPHAFTETFTTTTWMDPATTTASWGEGLLTRALDATLLGAYDSPDQSSDVCVSGRYAYVADRTGGLLIVDTSNPAAPVLLGSYANGNYIQRVAVDGDHAVITERDDFHPLGYWRIIDVSDPTDPVLVGMPAIWRAVANDVVLDGDLCVMASGDGVHFVDITDVTAPDPLTMYDAGTVCLGVDLQGRYAYVAISGAVVVLDIADPSAPTLAGSVEVASAYRIAVDGRYAYVACTGGQLRVVDVGDPSAPAVVAEVAATGARDVALEGDWAYVSAGDAGLHVFDIRNPLAPLHARVLDTPGYAQAAAVTGNLVHLADGTGGVRVYRMAAPLAPPELVSTRSTSYAATGVAVTGNLALITEHGDAGLGRGILRILDVSNPQNVNQIGSYGGFALGNKAVGVAAAGDRAFVLTDYEDSYGHHSGVLHTIDISDPSAVAETDFVSFMADARPQCITLRGGYAYIGCRTTSVSWGVIIIDVHDPDNLAIAGHAPALDFDVTDLELVGNSMYAAEPNGSYNEHFLAFDATSPTAPVLSWHGYMGYGIRDVFACGDCAYSVGPAFYAYDIGDPLSPLYAGHIPYTGQGFRRLAPAGRYLAVDMDAGFGLVDINDPTSPAALADLDHAGNARQIVVAGDYAYVASSGESPGSFAGLQVFRVFEHATTGNNRGQSLAFDGSTLDIYGARITTAQTGSLSWYLTADGVHWEAVTPGDDWHIFQYPGSSLRWRCFLNEPSGGGTVSCDEVTVEWHLEDVADVPGTTVPERFALRGSTPNPFNGTTRVGFDVPRGGGDVALDLYDTRGRLVRRLAAGFRDEGRHHVAWDGRDAAGRAVPAGVYHCRLQAAGCDETVKLTYVP